MTSAQLFLDHLPHIEKVVAHLCRRYHFRKEECEDFLGEVKKKLIEDDYAVIRKFQGRSRLTTYLTMVITNYMKDYQNHLWGKWRPSAEADRLGPVAILLEKFLVRDGYSFNEVAQILQMNNKIEMSWQELHAIAERLPARSPRRMEGEEELRDLASSAESADEHLAKQERAGKRRKALKALQEVRNTLPKEDQLVLNMQERGFSVADISRTLQLDQKQLYRRIQKIYKDLREELEREDVGRDDIEGLFDA
jgi:RNA polymerase sigma factor for flagellar operon FliA